MNKEVLFKIKKKLESLANKTIGEAQTKESFINPIISAMGWDITDFDEVKLEYKHTKKDMPVDYAIFIDLNPKLFIEAKQLGLNMDDHKWIAQMLTYSTMAGVKWALLTDGNHYKLYNTMAEAKLDEKLFFEWKMEELTEDNVDKYIDFLNLLSKEKFKDDAIEIAWKNHFEVNKVKETLEKLIDDRDELLLKLINKKTKLGKTVVANSLNKLKIKIEKVYQPDIPVISHIPTKRPRKGVTGKTPEKVILFGNTFNVKTWRDVLINAAERLIKHAPEEFNKLADSEMMRGATRIYLTRSKNLIRAAHQLSNGLFIDVGLSASSIVRLAKKILKGCGYKETDIEIITKN
jgi:predicted type IV restriction endonuclease